MDDDPCDPDESLDDDADGGVHGPRLTMISFAVRREVRADRERERERDSGEQDHYIDGGHLCSVNTDVVRVKMLAVHCQSKVWVILLLSTRQGHEYPGLGCSYARPGGYPSILAQANDTIQWQIEAPL